MIKYCLIPLVKRKRKKSVSEGYGVTVKIVAAVVIIVGLYLLLNLSGTETTEDELDELALDVAAVTGVSVEEADDMVAKAYVFYESRDLVGRSTFTQVLAGEVQGATDTEIQSRGIDVSLFEAVQDANPVEVAGNLASGELSSAQLQSAFLVTGVNQIELTDAVTAAAVTLENIYADCSAAEDVLSIAQAELTELEQVIEENREYAQERTRTARRSSRKQFRDAQEQLPQVQENLNSLTVNRNGICNNRIALSNFENQFELLREELGRQIESVQGSAGEILEDEIEYDFPYCYDSDSGKWAEGFGIAEMLPSHEPRLPDLCDNDYVLLEAKCENNYPIRVPIVCSDVCQNGVCTPLYRDEPDSKEADETVDIPEIDAEPIEGLEPGTTVTGNGASGGFGGGGGVGGAGGVSTPPTGKKICSCDTTAYNTKVFLLGYGGGVDKSYQTNDLPLQESINSRIRDEIGIFTKPAGPFLSVDIMFREITSNYGSSTQVGEITCAMPSWFLSDPAIRYVPKHPEKNIECQEDNECDDVCHASAERVEKIVHRIVQSTCTDQLFSTYGDDFTILTDRGGRHTAVAYSCEAVEGLSS